MGDIADAMLDGTLCNSCGCALDGTAPGFPRWCWDDRDEYDGTTNEGGGLSPNIVSIQAMRAFYEAE